MNLALSLIYGALAAAAALLLEILVSGPLVGFTYLLAAVVLEEGSKLLFLLRLTQRESFSPHTSFLLLQGVLFGLGFAGVELALLRPDFFSLALTLGSIHILTSLLYTWGLSRRDRSILIGTFILGLAIHGVYNFVIA